MTNRTGIKHVEVCSWKDAYQTPFYWISLKYYNGFPACESCPYKRLYDCREKAREIADQLGVPVVEVKK